MEYNKDESIRCLELAKSYLAKGEKTKAVKFATKSEQLYPSEEARAFIGKINQQDKADSRSGTDNSNTASSNGVRSRKKAESNGVSGAYTEEQVRAVKRIKQCKDYYEILGIERSADENEIKKKYRKLALQFHPDKNHAPGAAEAFKAISNAFSVLSDQSKRRKYDVSGPDNSSNGYRNNREWDYSHGFESEMSPDEIFNMFFGGGNFTTETHTNGNGATAHTFRRHHHQNSEDWHQLLLQLSPVLILVILSVFSMSYTGNNPYSLSQNNEYSEKRTTENLQVVYFVMSDFGKKYHKGSVHRIEQEIEGLYISNLRNECYQERITKEKLRRLAQNSNDAKAFEKAETFDMKNCRRLDELYS